MLVALPAGVVTQNVSGFLRTRKEQQQICAQQMLPMPDRFIFATMT